MSDDASTEGPVKTTISVERHATTVALVLEEPQLAKRKRTGHVGREFFQLTPDEARILGRALIATAVEIDATDLSCRLPGATR